MSDDYRDRITAVLKHYPQVQRAVLFGSRAKGTARNGSDTDLALEGQDLDDTILVQIRRHIDDLLLPVSVDVIHCTPDTKFLLPQSRERGFAAAQVTVEPESLIDEEARTHRTDLLLQFSRPRRGGATRAASAYVYVLYEHKSYSYRWVTVQLLRYMATIWQRLTGETDKHGDGLLPEILPVVIYHGKRAVGGAAAVCRAGRRRP